MTWIARSWPVGLCRHCNRTRKLRGRELCHTCYSANDIRTRYPGASAPDTASPSLPLPEPTTAAPGTPAKLAVLEARRKAKTALYHPADATMDGATGAGLLENATTATRQEKYAATKRARARVEPARTRCKCCRKPWERTDGFKCCPVCRARAANTYHARKARTA